MRSSYTESYKDLFHGTTIENATKIVESQSFIPSKIGWCGNGVYFYDNKSKAWWSANRTCTQEKKKGNSLAKPSVVIADISKLNKTRILDLRSPDDLKSFADFVNEWYSKNDNKDFSVVEATSEEEHLRLKRAMFLSFYCKKTNRILVIGYFKQRVQAEIDKLQDFATEWQLAIGIETIYCVKDTGIICNIRRV